MLAGPVLAALNHLLHDADQARARLHPFAGSAARIEVPPLSFALAVAPGGALTQAPPDAEPAVILRLSGATLVRLVLLREEGARQDVGIEGDAAFAAALSAALSGLRWDAEEDLSRLIGDVAARRFTRAGSAFLAWHARAASNLAHSLTEYWTEEQPLLAGRESVREFVRAVDVLRDDVERLEQRIERLASRRAPRADS